MNVESSGSLPLEGLPFSDGELEKDNVLPINKANSKFS
jgi:hypothetical protein